MHSDAAALPSNDTRVDTPADAPAVPLEEALQLLQHAGYELPALDVVGKDAWLMSLSRYRHCEGKHLVGHGVSTCGSPRVGHEWLEKLSRAVFNTAGIPSSFGVPCSIFDIFVFGE